MLRARSTRTDPAASAPPRSRPRPTASSTAWIEFETAVGRGSGHLRLTDEGAWTLLTTLDELKGHEEPPGERRPQGRRARRRPGPGDLGGGRARRERDETGPHHASRTCVVVGGGQGGIALGARLRQLGVPHVVIDRHARPGDQWRSRYKSLCLHDPVWYDHLPYLPFPTNWPVFAPEGQDRRLAGDVHEGHGAQLLALHDLHERRATTRRPASGPSSSTATASSVTLQPEAAGARHRHVGQAERARRSRARTSSAASSTIQPQHPGPDAYAGKRAVVIGSNNSAHDICARAVGDTAPT